MPLSAVISVAVTVAVFTSKSDPDSDSPMLAPLTVSTVVPAAPIAVSASTALPRTWYVNMPESVSGSASSASIVS